MKPKTFGIFFDVVNGERFLFPSSEAAERFLATVPSQRYFEFFVWLPGWSKWRNLDSVFKSVQEKVHTASISVQDIQNEVPEGLLPNTKSNSVEVVRSPKAVQADAIFDGNNFRWSRETDKGTGIITISNPIKVAEGRKHPRFQARLEFSLVSDSKIFRSYSKNVSLSGALLEDEIPSNFFYQPFEVIISVPSTNGPGFSDRIFFKGKVVGDISDPYRLTFTESNPETLARLEKVIINSKAA